MGTKCLGQPAEYFSYTCSGGAEYHQQDDEDGSESEPNFAIEFSDISLLGTNHGYQEIVS